MLTQVGKPFTRLTGKALTRVATAVYQCHCGNFKAIKVNSVATGMTESCGCSSYDFAKKHGMTETPEYLSWGGMIQRCCNPKNDRYPSYGGRGIAVCQDWRDSFEKFLSDMGPRPDGMSLDRIDCNAGYHKDNCRWATRHEQQSNKRNTPMLTINGITQSIAIWSKTPGASAASTISCRKLRGRHTDFECVYGKDQC